MKCVNIVYKKEKLYQQYPDLQLQPVKKSVDQYYTRLIEKQKGRIQYMSEPRSSRLDIRTSKSFRTRNQYINQMSQSLNIAKIKTSSVPISSISMKFTDSLTKSKINNNFSIKKKQKGIFSLKALKDRDNDQIQNFQNSMPATYQKQQNHTKIKPLQKVKLIKQSTILISIDFILNEENFWQQQDIDQQAAKNWKHLQDFSNIIWLVKRQNTNKKLQKYCLDFGLRLDGVYQIIPHQKQKALTLSLIPLQKQIKIQFKSLKKQKDTLKKLIIINSLRVENIKNVQYQDFFNLLPVTKSLPCVVHFIQVDMQDKSRFNSPLKILSKQCLPPPTKLNKIMQKFEKEQKDQNKERVNAKQRKFKAIPINMMEQVQILKQNYMRYFSQTLRLNPNQKVIVQDSQISLQYLIGDMLKRNFNILSFYQKQSRKISYKLKSQSQPEDQYRQKFIRSSTSFSNKKYSMPPQIKNNFQFVQTNHSSLTSKTVYQHPVYLWKK